MTTNSKTSKVNEGDTYVDKKIRKSTTKKERRNTKRSLNYWITHK